MPRPKGSKNKKTLEREKLIAEGKIKEVPKKQKKIKKIVNNTSLDEHIKQLSTKKEKTVLPKYALKLTDWLYITCDRHCWMIKEVNNKINPTTGEKYPDKSFLYAGNLNQILHVAVNHMIRIPVGIEELSNKIDEIHSLIDSRVPADTRPKDFLEIIETSDEEEDEE